MSYGSATLAENVDTTVRVADRAGEDAGPSRKAPDRASQLQVTRPAGSGTPWASVGALVDEIGAVPCRTSDPEAWWPDRRDLDSPATRLAVAGCWRCPAREACLAYAVAANEREGV